MPEITVVAGARPNFMKVAPCCGRFAVRLWFRAWYTRGSITMPRCRIYSSSSSASRNRTCISGSDPARTDSRRRASWSRSNPIW
jgi:hypothetical protein